MSQAGENRRQFIANEISLGFTYIESARLSYSMNHTEHGQSAQAKGEAAYSGALHFLEADTSGETEVLTKELKRLRVALDDLQSSLS